VPIALAAAIVATGCGGAGGSPAASTAARALSSTGRDPYAWLRPAAAPADWRRARLPSGAVLAYPGSWRAIHGDRGTASAALLDSAGRYLGYLNLTPRQGDETRAGWSSFRVSHNAGEGERNAALEASAAGLRFRTGSGSCVTDSYTTSIGTRYREIACLVQGTRTSSVIIAAAPVERWPAQLPALERSIAALTT